jgi:RNA polymerase sigma-B factor
MPPTATVVAPIAPHLAPTAAAPSEALCTDAVEDLLARRRRSQDPDERAELEEAAVVQSLRLAEMVARRYVGRGMEYDDLLQVARLALVKAVRRYRPGAGSGFTAYAVPTIAGEVKRHFRDCGWTVRPPRRLQEFKARLAAQEERLLHELHREPTLADLAEALKATPAEVTEARLSSAAYSAYSLDTPTTVQGRPEVAGQAPDEYAALEMREALRGALAKLNPRERQLVRLRFVDELTQAEVGRILGVSQMQVSRLLTGVLRQLRAQLLADEAGGVRADEGRVRRSA